MRKNSKILIVLINLSDEISENQLYYKLRIPLSSN